MEMDLKKPIEVEIQRKEALLWGISQGSDDVVERMLNAGVELPDAAGSFYITVNGIPVCMVDQALAGHMVDDIRCEYGSLRQAILSRAKAKKAFPAAIVSIRTGSCPRFSSARNAA